MPGYPKLPRQLRVAAVLLLAPPAGYLLGRVVASALTGSSIEPLDFGGGRALGVLATILGTGFIAYLLTTRARLAAEAQARLRAQQLATESQLRMLRAQLDPHMLFNTLANLHSLVDENPQQAKAMIDRLIVFLRSTLAASRSVTSTLGREFTLLKAYLDLMRMRLGPRLSFTLELPHELEDTTFPVMLLQPLVENALRHGIEPKVGPGQVNVRALVSGGFIEVAVTDDGLGMQDVPDVLDASGERPSRGPGEEPSIDTSSLESGYGLTHVRERLAVQYGGQASLSIVPTRPGPGTVVTVRVPRQATLHSTMMDPPPWPSHPSK